MITEFLLTVSKPFLRADAPPLNKSSEIASIGKDLQDKAAAQAVPTQAACPTHSERLAARPVTSRGYPYA